MRSRTCATGHIDKNLRHAQTEEWPRRGHFLHLVEPDRFTARLLAFVEHCRSAQADRDRLLARR